MSTPLPVLPLPTRVIPLRKDANHVKNKAPVPGIVASDPPAPPVMTIPQLTKDARATELARRLVMGQNPGQIATEMNATPSAVRAWLKTPEVQDAYQVAKASMIANIDDLIVNEQMAPLLRARAQAVRSLTIVHEIMSEIRDRVLNGRAKATEMKVAVDAAFGLIDRAKMDLSRTMEKGGTVNAEQINFNLSPEQSQFVRDTLKESGLDLSDIIDITPVADVEPADATT